MLILYSDYSWQRVESPTGWVGLGRVGSNKFRFSVGRVGSGPNPINDYMSRYSMGRVGSRFYVSALVTSKKNNFKLMLK